MSERSPDLAALDAARVSAALLGEVAQVPSAPERFRYTPALDGLRAVAILLVIWFHYPWGTKWPDRPWAHGGFLGVDVFFVLSGFLITTLLLEEKLSTGRVSLRSFYARRALRLFPALAVIATLALVSHFFFVRPSQRPSMLGVVSLIGYFSNWAEIWRVDPLGPLFGQTWSLAIEEQFYLAFPILMIGLFALRLRRGSLAAVLGIGAAVSALWRLYLWNVPRPPAAFVDWYAEVTGRHIAFTASPFDTWNRWYFGTDTRLDGLLIGATAAVLYVWLRPRMTATIRNMLVIIAGLSIAGIGIIISQAYILADWVPNWGMALVAVLTAIAAVAMVTSPMSWLARIFGFRPLVWIGRRSYAIYLFHQIVYYELGRDRTHLNPQLSFLLKMVVIGVVAELSWRFVESPFIRRKGRFARV